ncbi:MAG: hypothetical protein CSA76_00745 [Spirochaetales bacterium]|nr:MAG: hypothetical protein CSA76_00745 [Spirochaetales bacterium]
MFFFLIKKSFFDAWDNLAALLLSNLSLFLIFMAGFWPLSALWEKGISTGWPILVLLVPALFTAGGTTSSLMSKIADYQRVSWSDIGAALKKTWKGSLLFALLLTVFFPVTFFGMQYYAALKSTLGLAAMALLFWVTLGVWLTAVWFFPVRNRLGGKWSVLLKKSALIMLDNPGFSLFAGIIVLPLMMVLWLFTAFVAFGPAGFQLYMDGALRLLMFKYDWMETHQGARKKDVPWYELLFDERERVGKRTLKGMIFPWKE